jgi:hypothetical protein
VETPRTDALERQHKSGFGNTFYGEMAQHARQLERELACAKSAERASLREKIKNDPELPCEAGPMLEPVDLRAAIDEAIRRSSDSTTKP